MICAARIGDTPVCTVPPPSPETEAKQNRARIELMERIDAPAVRIAYRQLMAGAKAFTDAGLYQEAEKVLDTLVCLLLRWCYLLAAGKLDTTLSEQKLLMQLRGINAIDREGYNIIKGILERKHGREHRCRGLYDLADWLHELLGGLAPAPAKEPRGFTEAWPVYTATAPPSYQPGRPTP